MDDTYIYKQLDNAHLGHEDAKKWVSENLSRILDLIDRYDVQQQDADGLQSRIDDLEEQLSDEEADTGRLEEEVAELQEEINDLKRQLAEALDEEL